MANTETESNTRKKQNTTKNIQEAQSGRLDLCGVDQQNNEILRKIEVFVRWPLLHVM